MGGSLNFSRGFQELISSFLAKIIMASVIEAEEKKESSLPQSFYITHKDGRYYL